MNSRTKPSNAGKPVKPLKIQARPDRDRRVRQSDRIARVLRVLGLIQSGKNYDVQKIASEVGCSTRTVSRDLETLTVAGVPWYFDKKTASYRLPPNYRFPIRLLVEETAMPIPSQRGSHYRDYFDEDSPMSRLEIDFLARWIHETHNLSELHASSLWAMKWNGRLNLPSVALANFHTMFMSAFQNCPDAFIRTVWQSNVDFLTVPWKTEAELLARNEAICNWLKQTEPASVIDIETEITEFRSHQ